MRCEKHTDQDEQILEMWKQINKIYNTATHPDRSFHQA